MISVIVPVYNTGKKLNKCLSSLFNQTFTDWECILVNDCSSDKTTIKILDEWVRKDSRFVLINNPHNLGIEKNRFVAIDRILAENRSQYLMFMDHDDWLYSNNSLEYLYENAISSGADVTIGRHNEAHFMFQKAGYNPVPSGLITQPELKDKYYISYFGAFLMPLSIWARLYSIDLVRKAKMKPQGLVFMDDHAWNLLIMPYANSVLMLDKVVYVHRWGGLTSKPSAQLLKEYNLLYRIRRQAMIDFDFPQGRFLLDCQQKNILASYIYYSILYSRVEKETILYNVNLELQNGIWEDVDESIKKRDDAFSKALLNRDLEKMYEIQYLKSNSPKNKLKLFLRNVSRILS